MTKLSERLRSLASLTVALLVLTAGPVFAENGDTEGGDPHLDIFSEEAYPSATLCQPCHEQIYDEWRGSSHAYAAISPVFHKFEQAISNLAPTIGTFCVRCHISVGTAMDEARDLPLWERSRVAREGVTCVTCHRVDEEYFKVNGERRIVPGTIHDPVFGNEGGPSLDEVVDNSSAYRVSTSEAERGVKIHTEAKTFAQISESEMCVSCHQVAVNIGIKLEVVWDQYRDSPAFREGISCQDCHMTDTPGVPSGYSRGPAAVVAGEPINPDREHHNHGFIGPGYPIAHPGIFPHNPDAENWTAEEWLQFDYRAGWGDPDWELEYEEAVDEGDREEIEFPEVWSDSFDREEARLVIEDNLEKIREKAELRSQLMEAGSRIDGPFFDDDPSVGSDLDFTYTVTNLNSGHNLPSGSLGAQPEIWLNVVLTGPDGEWLWESGYVDSNGDMADLHSLDVAAGTVEHDDQLFNLQTKFLTTNVKGTDREMYLPVQFDIDQLPFLRPAAQPVTVMNHPPFVRMEGRSIPPLGSRDADYSVPSDLMKKPGTYKLSVRMRSRAEPIYFMKFIGSTPEMIRAMNEWMLDIHPYTVEFEVK